MTRYITYIDIRQLLRALDHLDERTVQLIISRCIRNEALDVDMDVLSHPLTYSLLHSMNVEVRTTLPVPVNDIFVLSICPPFLKLVSWRNIDC